MKLTFKKEVNKVNLERAIHIFDISFRGLFEKRITEKADRKALYKLILENEDILYAYDEKGKVVGLCGIATKENNNKVVKVKDLRRLLGFSVGVVFASFFDNRKAVKKNELCISFIAVDKKERRRKIATKMVNKVLEYSTTNNKNTIFVDNVPGNTPADKLFIKFDFSLKEKIETKKYKKAFGVEFDNYNRYVKIL